mgnify:FL=1
MSTRLFDAAGVNVETTLDDRRYFDAAGVNVETLVEPRRYFDAVGINIEYQTVHTPTELTVIKSLSTGVDPQFVVIDPFGNRFYNNGQTVVIVRNEGTGDLTVVFDSPFLLQGLEIQDPSVTIGAGESLTIGPFRPLLFNNEIGRVGITYSGTTANVYDSYVAAITR